MRCPQCAAYFRVQTVTVDGRPVQRPVGNGQSSYQATFRDDRGEPVTQAFTGPLGMQLTGHDTASLVWEGRHLRGIANQTQRLWYPLSAYVPDREPLRVNGKIAGAVAVAVALAMLATYRDALGDALVGGGVASVALVILALVVVVAPWVSDTLARRGTE